MFDLLFIFYNFIYILLCCTKNSGGAEVLDFIKHQMAIAADVWEKNGSCYISLFTNEINKNPPNGTVMQTPPMVQASRQ